MCAITFGALGRGSLATGLSFGMRWTDSRNGSEAKSSIMDLSASSQLGSSDDLRDAAAVDPVPGPARRSILNSTHSAGQTCQQRMRTLH